MKVVYVAGPFRGATAWEIECNVRRAEQMALEIAKLGAMPLCPHTNTRFFHGTLTDRFWIDGTAELVRRCDAVICLPTWPESQGATAERSLAKGLRLAVFDTLWELKAWLLSFPE